MLSLMASVGTMIRLSVRRFARFSSRSARCGEARFAGRPAAPGDGRTARSRGHQPEQPLDVPLVHAREAPGLGEGLPQRDAGDRHWSAGERAAVEHQRVAVTGRGLGESALRAAAPT